MMVFLIDLYWLGGSSLCKGLWKETKSNKSKMKPQGNRNKVICMQGSHATSHGTEKAQESLTLAVWYAEAGDVKSYSSIYLEKCFYVLRKLLSPHSMRMVTMGPILCHADSHKDLFFCLLCDQVYTNTVAPSAISGLPWLKLSCEYSSQYVVTEKERTTTNQTHLLAPNVLLTLNEF